MTLGAALTEGYLVSDRFQLLRLLGRGGMGSVWVARHLSLKIEVAIKFIDGPLGGREDLRSRFAQEARTAARIQSPHVVNILDYGFDGIRPFIVMELLQGEALNVRLEREGRIGPGELSVILTQAAKGLGRAHSLGIVHRDLKPDNLFLTRDEEGAIHVKLLDFGIARDETPLSAVSHRTGTGQLLGTPAYMSPEQALGKGNVDYRSDLYSLAVVVFHCMTGRLPFDSEAMGELLVSISMREPPVASSFLPGLSPDFDAWFYRAFQKDAARRFGSTKEMAEAFAYACRFSPPAAAFDRTVLAPDGSGQFPHPSRFGSAPPTQLTTGTAAAGTPPPVAGWSTPGSGPPTRGSLPAAVTAPMAQPVLVQTAPWAPAPHFNPSPPPPPPVPMAATGNAASVRVPDTFNGQSATQGGDRPVPRSRGPAPLVLALVGLVLLVAVGGAGVFATRLRGSATGPAAASASAAGSVGSTEGVGVPSVPPVPSVVTAAPSASVVSPALSALPSSVPATEPPHVVTAPAAISSSPPAPHRPAPKPTAGSGAPSHPAPTPKPAPTNDYGL